MPQQQQQPISALQEQQQQTNQTMMTIPIHQQKQMSQTEQQQQMIIKQQQQLQQQQQQQPQMQEINEMIFNQGRINNMDLIMQEQQLGIINQLPGSGFNVSGNVGMYSGNTSSQQISQMNSRPGQMQSNVSNFINTSTGLQHGSNLNKSLQPQDIANVNISQQQQISQQQHQPQQYSQMLQGTHFGQNSQSIQPLNQLNQQQQQSNQLNKNFEEQNLLRINTDMNRSASLGSANSQSSNIYPTRMTGEESTMNTYLMHHSIPVYNISNQLENTANSIGQSQSQVSSLATINSQASIRNAIHANSNSSSASAISRNQLSASQARMQSQLSHSTELSPILDVSPSIEAAEAQEILDRRRMVSNKHKVVICK